MIKGKVVCVNGGEILVSYGYTLTDGHNCFHLCGGINGLLSRFKLTRRFFRSEITNLYTLQDGTQLAIARKGIFKRKADEKVFSKICSVQRGSKPLNLCVTPDGRVFFGEYFQNTRSQAIHIYSLNVETGNLEKVYTFDEGEINHIHGLFFDKYTNRIWVATGDKEHECIIGFTEDEFKSFTVVFRGGQEVRSCQLFFYPDFIVYCTDSQFIQNTIKYVDRKSLEVRDIQAVQGSVIKGGQVGNISFFSTTVEPSAVNLDKHVYLWVTKDGLHWEERYKDEKDCFPALFQFGSFEFPHYVGEIGDRLYFSGRAVKHLDGKSAYVEL